MVLLKQNYHRRLRKSSCEFSYVLWVLVFWQLLFTQNVTHVTRECFLHNLYLWLCIHTWYTYTKFHVGLGNISINPLIKYLQYNYCMHLFSAILSPRQYLLHLAIIIALSSNLWALYFIEFMYTSINHVNWLICSKEVVFVKNKLSYWHNRLFKLCHYALIFCMQYCNNRNR